MEAIDTRITNRLNQLQMSRKQQVYGFGLITAIVIIVLSVGALKPSIETIVKLRSEIEQKEMILDKLETKIQVINSLNLQYEEFQDTAKDLGLIFPANGDFSLFLANIESITEKSGFKLESVSFTKKKTGSLAFQLLSPKRVQLGVMGKKQNLIPFLKTLEELPFYPEINTVSFSEEVDDDGNTDFSIALTIYEVNKTNFYD